MSDDVMDITPQQVEQFLTENPTFFLKRDHLLADLYLPHASGEAVSLLEKQVNILRERNIETRKRLNEMLEQGQRNDVLFTKTKDLILNILSSNSLSDLSNRLTEYCESEFQVEKVQFSLFASPELYTNTQSRVIAMPEVERSMPSLLKASECISGVFREEELKFLFANQYDNIASAIILPIKYDNKLTGMLSLGSDDPHYFQAGMDTLFLNFIGDVIGKLLPRFSGPK